MVLGIIAAASTAAGVIQSVTGFGSAIVLMLVIPFFFDMVASSAIASSIAMGLGITLAWKFRRHIEWKTCFFPAIVYLVSSVAIIYVIRNIDLDVLTMTFGLFLVALAVYFLIFAKRVSFTANWKTASVCSLISGITAGLFGIGGPLMAVYFVAASKGKESYIGNIQFVFALSNIITFITRISRGIYTMDMIPITICGFFGIMLGKQIGLRILERVDLEMVKKSVYIFVGVSGVLTVLQNL